jgi:hypothetical protein
MTFDQILVLTISLGAFSSFIFLCGIFDSLSSQWRIILPTTSRYREVWKENFQDFVLYSISTPTAVFLTYLNIASL